MDKPQSQNQQQPLVLPPDFKSMEDYMIFNFTVTQLKFLSQIERYLERHGKDQTLDLIKALKDSLK